MYRSISMKSAYSGILHVAQRKYIVFFFSLLLAQVKVVVVLNMSSAAHIAIISRVRAAELYRP